MILRKAAQLAGIRKTERMDPAALRDFQREALQRALGRAYRTIPYYRERFDDAGLRPDGHTELSSLPLTRREDLAGVPLAQRTSSDTPRAGLRLLRSSGTSGRPVELACDRAHFNRRAAAILHTLLVNGYRLRDDIACFERSPRQRRFPHPLLRFYHRVRIPFEAPIEEQARQVHSMRPRVVLGYASWVAEVSRTLVELKLTDGLQPYLVVTNSEQLTEAMRDSIREAFHVEPTNVYDTWEFGNVAWQCPERRGLHTNGSMLIVEILDAEGREVAPGESGEVVVTELHNRAAPLLRYALGDRALRGGDGCPCGRQSPQIAEIQGRTSEVLVGADGRAMPASVAVAGLMRSVAGVREYQVRQRSPGQIELLLSLDARFGDREALQLENEFRRLFRIDDVELHRVARIERTEAGKLRPIVSEIEPSQTRH